LNVHSQIGANIDVSRAAAEYFGRGWIFLLTGFLCLVGFVDTTRAAGCHMQDRIVLGSTPSWEKQLVVDLSAEPRVQFPPVLAKSHCQGEVPTIVDFNAGWTTAALVPTTPFDLPDLSDFVSPQSASEPIRHQPLRLDRPPRTTLSRITAQSWA